MTRYPLLDICARVTGHPEQHSRLREHCRTFKDWDKLLFRAVQEGMIPLLKKHLEESDSTYPASTQEYLDILANDVQHHTMVRIGVLQNILELFQKNNLHPLVIKGAALCHTVYPDPALRPMRDLDLLFRRVEAPVAQELLKLAEFIPSTSPIPADHHHLPTLLKDVDGMIICVEVHHGLYPNCPPYYPDVHFEQLLATARPFRTGGVDALTLSDEETLKYLYQHAFRPPLAYESYKLINAADIISLVEKHPDTLLKKIPNNKDLLLSVALPLMHHISPWDCSRVPGDFLSSTEKKRKLKPVPFAGWPVKRRKELKAEGKGLWHILPDTFFPSIWWLGVYYGVKTWREYLYCVLVAHPRHILWWVRLYASLPK